MEGHMATAPDRAEIALGNPSFVWRFGQDRRLNLIRHFAPLEGARTTPGLTLSASETLPFRDAAFDVVVLNEVIEHVRDDAATLAEALRVIRPGGHIVIYAPNRLFPFETHGIYIGQKFIFGNIPFVNWLPDPLRNRLVPHARAYTQRGIRRTYQHLDASVNVATYVYPGFDNIIARRKWLGRALRAALYRAERTPLKVFGLSHFVVLEKPAADTRVEER